MSKLFSHFSSFGPEMALSTHSQSIECSNTSSKENILSSSSENDTPYCKDAPATTKQRLRVNPFYNPENINPPSERNHEDRVTTRETSA